jgi:hypothetical protein
MEKVTHVAATSPLKFLCLMSCVVTVICSSSALANDHRSLMQRVTFPRPLVNLPAILINQANYSRSKVPANLPAPCFCH